jgi:hypothetical protein
VAAAQAISPALVRETGVITSFLSQAGQTNLYYDGSRMWISYDKGLIAFDPQTRHISLEPIVFEEAVSGMISDGRQLWVALPTALYPVDAVSGQVGPAIYFDGFPEALAYDGAHIWLASFTRDNSLNGKHTLQAVDPISHEALPPIETGQQKWSLVFDEARQFLWIVNASGTVQQYDLKQNVLQDTPLHFKSSATDTDLHFDGQRLWTMRGSVGQSLDVDTGKTTDLANPTARIVSSAFDGKRIWFGNDDWTVQPFDVATGQLGAAIPVHGFPRNLAFDGKRLWVALYDEVYNAGQHFARLQYLVPNEG